ncbi:hypothetical protein ARMSODRAFT_441148 [Armillaria solidipes]|uniref:Uncharacterized protein n=1 Tax=Armillaria solidipes TaxID=1076256 RepID=A0A2H3BQD6_9AGAR|nr:hypothetical protein ARMSODRAFT_441148 [Armillaria solidipes]
MGKRPVTTAALSCLCYRFSRSLVFIFSRLRARFPCNQHGIIHRFDVVLLQLFNKRCLHCAFQQYFLFVSIHGRVHFK